MDPWALAAAHEHTAEPDRRRARGAWYTPRDVVVTLVAMAIGPDRPMPRRVLDPSCGAGAFLLGVLDRLVALGVDPSDALERVAGTDIDAGAVRAADEAVAAWAEAHRVRARSVASVADALAPPEGPAPDLIVGNPPFATPLKGDPLPAEAERARAAAGPRFGPYADLAAIHLAAAWDRLAPGGRLTMVVPQSLVASRDTAGLRAELEGRTVDAWASTARHFDANVRVWAPLLERDPAATEAESPSIGWADRVADALGLPAAPAATETLGDAVVATSGFRDEYYALAAACRESTGSSNELRLCTVGALDPLDLLWGRRPTRLAKADWQQPVVDPADLSERRAWVERVARPKVLLPTQSRVLEPVVDDAGRLVPVTPVLAAWPADGADLDLARLAALFLAPSVSAWALRRRFGTALSSDAIKLAARDLAEVPLPVDDEAWARAATLVGEGRDAVGRIGRLMAEAYHADDAVLAWWERRRPRREE